MELILLTIYFTFCWIIIKIFKIPINKWTITTVFLGAVVMLGPILAGMAYFHPSSKTARSYFISTDIVPNVRGKIIEIPVQTNVSVHLAVRGAGNVPEGSQNCRGHDPARNLRPPHQPLHHRFR